MLVIHPADSTTKPLQLLYESRRDVTCLNGEESRNKVADILYHRPKQELLMLLGHGNPEGLYRLEEGEYKCYIGRSMAYSLRRHFVIGIFCHANLFAEQLNLHGIFSGMVISELEEAELYGVSTTKEELAIENLLYASNLRTILDSGCPYKDIPAMLIEKIGDGPEVRRFNYERLFVF